MPVFEPGITFTDVPVGHWCESAIAYHWERGLVAGYDEPDGTRTFRGEPPIEQRVAGIVTRYEQVAFNARSLQYIEANLSVTNEFVSEAGANPDPKLVDGPKWNKPLKVALKVL